MAFEHPGKHLTAAQQKYLLALYRLQITGVRQVDVANELGVSKASTHKIIHDLMEEGYIMRRNRCEIYLSEQGQKLAEQLDDLYTTVTQYLLNNLELEGEQAQKEALDLALCMSPDFIDAFLRKIEDARTGRVVRSIEKQQLSEVLKEGIYQVPFQLLRQKEDKVSMGDKGFDHPCMLELRNGVCTLYLTLCDLTYRSVAGRILQGSLEHLWYYENGICKEAEITHQGCRIPVDQMQLQFDTHGNLRSGEINVRVRSSVGTFAMPESQARLKFNFRACKRLPDNEAGTTA